MPLHARLALPALLFALQAAPALDAAPPAPPLEKGGAIIVEGRAQMATTSSLSERSARQMAETRANLAFIKYCLDKMPLPAKTEDLRAEIISTIMDAALPSVTLIGATPVTTTMAGGEVVCVLTVPKTNIAPVLENCRYDNLDALLALAQKENKLLHYELCARTGRPVSAAILLEGVGQPQLRYIVNGYPATRLPDFWKMKPSGINEVEKALAAPENWEPSEDSMSILSLLDASLGIPRIYQGACHLLASHGYTHVADYFQKIKLPVAKIVDPGKAGLVAIQKIAKGEIDAAQASQKELPLLFSALVEIYGLLPLMDSKEANPKLDAAKKAFASQNTDWDSVEHLTLESLFVAPTADAFNLLGRVMEVSRGSPALAAYCYAQAYAMDKEHPYAAANLALLPPFKNISDAEAAALTVFWEARARENPNLAEWARAKLDARQPR